MHDYLYNNIVNDTTYNYEKRELIKNINANK